MFNGLWAPKEEYTPFTGEPPRTSLTEPPTGYRTPSPNQPYGVGKEKWTAPKIDRQERACEITQDAGSNRVFDGLRRYVMAAHDAPPQHQRRPRETALPINLTLSRRSARAVRRLGRRRDRCSPPRRKPRRSRTSATSRSPTASKSSWCRTGARRSSPTWSGTRSAPPTRRRASPASRISSNI